MYKYIPLPHQLLIQVQEKYIRKYLQASNQSPQLTSVSVTMCMLNPWQSPFNKSTQENKKTLTKIKAFHQALDLTQCHHSADHVTWVLSQATEQQVQEQLESQVYLGPEYRCYFQHILHIFKYHGLKYLHLIFCNQDWCVTWFLYVKIQIILHMVIK